MLLGIARHGADFRRWPALLVSIGMVGLLSSCAGDTSDVDLIIDLQTDMLPGTEFVLVRTEVSGADPVEIVVSAGDTSFVVAARAAEFTGLPRGTREIRVFLVDAAGTQVGVAGETIDQQADAAMTFRIASEACGGIGCPVAGGNPDESVCYRGRCVEPSCLDADTPDCPTPECATAAACPRSCQRASCDGGTCICYTDGGPSCDEVTCGPNATCDDRLRQPCACDEGYEGDGYTCTNIDECATSTDSCDPDATCTDTDGSYTCACPGGEVGDGFTCEDGCADGTAGCATTASCVMTEGGAECECLGGYAGDGRTCDRGEILVIASCDWEVLPADCGHADEAVTELGYGLHIIHGNPDAGTAAAISGRAWDLIIMDTWDSLLRTSAEMSFANYSAAGGRFIMAHSRLEVADAYVPMGIEAVSYDGWQDIHPTPMRGVDLFEQQHSVPPLVEERILSWTSGHILTTTEADGFLVARSGTPTGTGAIAVTNEGRTIVNGFFSYIVGETDADSDGRPDTHELYLNEITYLLAPRVLVYADEPAVRSAAEEVVTSAGYAVIRADAASFDEVLAVGDIAAVVALLSDTTPTTVPPALGTWVSGGGHLVLAWSGLDDNTALQTALEVTANSTTGAREIVARSAFGPSFFNLVDRVPGPVTGLTSTLELAGTGAAAVTTAHFDDRTGPGATVITRAGTVIVNGFDFPVAGPDADSDGVVDALELLRNEIHFVAR